MSKRREWTLDELVAASAAATGARWRARSP